MFCFKMSCLLSSTELYDTIPCTDCWNNDRPGLTTSGFPRCPPLLSGSESSALTFCPPSFSPSPSPAVDCVGMGGWGQPVEAVVGEVRCPLGVHQEVSPVSSTGPLRLRFGRHYPVSGPHTAQSLPVTSQVHRL